MLCVNLCEILSKELLENNRVFKLLDYVVNEHGEVSRIYFGSSFCCNYFIGLNNYNILLEYCKANSIPVTLCIPIPSEKYLARLKEKIKEIIDCCENIIDEFSVNDFGMMNYLKHEYCMKINMGRLFFKDTRDVRYSELFEKEVKPAFLSFDMCDYAINGIELDPLSKTINLSDISMDDYIIGIHIPYGYVTTSNICKFGSIHKPIEKKFRPNAMCGGECAKICEIFFEKEDSYSFEMLRYGKTVYYKNDKVDVKGDIVNRYIYFPVFEAMQLLGGIK